MKISKLTVLMAAAFAATASNAGGWGALSGFEQTKPNTVALDALGRPDLSVQQPFSLKSFGYEISRRPVCPGSLVDCAPDFMTPSKLKGSAPVIYRRSKFEEIEAGTECIPGPLVLCPSQMRPESNDWSASKGNDSSRTKTMHQIIVDQNKLYDALVKSVEPPKPAPAPAPTPKK